MRRYFLSLSTFAGVVFYAKHWHCRISWENEKGSYIEEDAERGAEDERTGRFNSKPAARRAGLALAKQLSNGAPYIVLEGNHAYIDPQEMLVGPEEIKGQLNVLWKAYDKLKGWDAPKSQWPEVQKICDQWTKLLEEGSK